MKQVGNIKANAIYNPDERRHPPPTNLIDSERDSELEKFIRAKYEYKSYMATGASGSAVMGSSVSLSSGPSVLSSSKSIDRSAAVAALLGPSRSASSKLSTRRDTAPPNSSLYSSTSSTFTPPLPPRPAATPPLPPRPAPPASAPPIAATNAPPSAFSASVSQPFGALSQLSQPSNFIPTTSTTQTINATLPLQVLTQPVTQPMAVPGTMSTPLSTTNPYSGLSASPMNPFPSAVSQPTGVTQSTLGRSMSLNMGLSGGMGAGVSPFQPSPLNPATPLNNPAPNPFTSQMMSSASSMGGIGMTSGFTGISPQPPTPFGQLQTQTPFGQAQPQAPFGQAQPQTPFGQPQTPFGAPSASPFGQQPVQQPQMFAPQPQMQMQTTAANPYMQSGTPGTPFGTPQYGVGNTPSPFAPAQPLMQAQPVQQMPQQGFGGANPFTSWIQQQPGQQGAGGYSWNGSM
ncbi:hypothetical protein EIP86_011482 [Pleurotus ostreatoroseus]|nr:hypothetical protein EIP86_011482 [Pleurotus ostreatoroseus]